MYWSDLLRGYNTNAMEEEAVVSRSNKWWSVVRSFLFHSARHVQVRYNFTNEGSPSPSRLKSTLPTSWIFADDKIHSFTIRGLGNPVLELNVVLPPSQNFKRPIIFAATTYSVFFPNSRNTTDYAFSLRINGPLLRDSSHTSTNCTLHAGQLRWNRQQMPSYDRDYTLLHPFTPQFFTKSLLLTHCSKMKVPMSPTPNRCLFPSSLETFRPTGVVLSSSQPALTLRNPRILPHFMVSMLVPEA